MAADPLEILRQGAKPRLWELSLILGSGMVGTVLVASGDALLGALTWALGLIVIAAASRRALVSERKAVDYVRTRAPHLSPEQREKELAAIEKSTEGDFGALPPRVRKLRRELEALE